MTSIGYVATRIERAGSHRVCFNKLDDNGAITNILITPSVNVRAVRLCTYDAEGIAYTIENSYLHKFLGKSITFRSTTDGKALPVPEQGGVGLDIECDDMVIISYEIVKRRGASRQQRQQRQVVSYMDEVYMDYGMSTPGMLKYTLPISLGNITKLFAFMPSDTTSVEMFIDGEEYGCPFLRHMTEDGMTTYYTFDMEPSSVENAVLVVRCSGRRSAVTEAVPMGLVGLHEKLLCFAH